MSLEQTQREFEELRQALQNAQQAFSAGNFAQAEVGYKRGVELSQQLYGGEHPETCECLQNLIETYFSLRRYADALPPLRRLLEVKQKTEPASPEIADFLFKLSRTYDKLGQQTESEAFHKIALKMGAQVFGPESNFVATVLQSMLKTLRRNQSKQKEADQIEERLRSLRAKMAHNTNRDTSGMLLHVPDTLEPGNLSQNSLLDAAFAQNPNGSPRSNSQTIRPQGDSSGRSQYSTIPPGNQAGNLVPPGMNVDAALRNVFSADPSASPERGNAGAPGQGGAQARGNTIPPGLEGGSTRGGSAAPGGYDSGSNRRNTVPQGFDSGSNRGNTNAPGAENSSSRRTTTTPATASGSTRGSAVPPGFDGGAGRTTIPPGRGSGSLAETISPGKLPPSLANSPISETGEIHRPNSLRFKGVDPDGSSLPRETLNDSQRVAIVLSISLIGFLGFCIYTLASMKGTGTTDQTQHSQALSLLFPDGLHNDKSAQESDKAARSTPIYSSPDLRRQITILDAEHALMVTKNGRTNATYTESPPYITLTPEGQNVNYSFQKTDDTLIDQDGNILYATWAPETTIINEMKVLAANASQFYRKMGRYPSTPEELMTVFTLSATPTRLRTRQLGRRSANCSGSMI